MGAQTATQRKAAERQRHKEAGLKRLPDLWAHPDDHPAIKAHAAKLSACRKRCDKRESR